MTAAATRSERNPGTRPTENATYVKRKMAAAIRSR